MDGNQSNHCAENLEWIESEHPTQFSSHSPRFCTRTAVWQVDSHTGRRIAIFRNYALAGEAVGTHSDGIGKCIAGMHSVCGGYKWERASRDDVYVHLVCSIN